MWVAEIMPPQYLTEPFTKCSKSNGLNLHSSERKLQISLLRTSIGQKAYCYCGVKLWNELSREAKLDKQEIFKELILLKERKLTNFSMLKLFITANNQESGNQFHSFTANSRINTIRNFCSSLFVLLFLRCSQN